MRHLTFGTRNYFPKGIFPRVTSWMTISQVATSQVCNFPSGNSPNVRLGPLRHRRLQWGPSAAARKDLGSCGVGNCTFGKFPLGKIPLGSCHLGKILWESTLHLINYTYCLDLIKKTCWILKMEVNDFRSQIFFLFFADDHHLRLHAKS